MTNKASAVVLIFNDQGKLALQQRVKDDDKYPLHWDFSAAGGIDQHELPDKAAVRELQEEIGMNCALTFLGEEVYQGEKGIDTLHIFKGVHNGPFHLNPREVEVVQFFSIEEVKNMIKSGSKFHPEFPYILDKGDGRSILSL